MRRLLLVEDHHLVAQALGAALRARGDQVEQVDPADFSRLEDLADHVVERGPDLVLLDLDLGELGAAERCIPRLVEADVRVLVLTGSRDPLRLARCVEGGALGILGKDEAFDDLVAGVDHAIEQGPLLTDDDRDAHLRLLRRHDEQRAQALRRFEELTPREGEVLQSLMAGRRVEDIARSDVVSVATVRSQVKSILRKLGVDSQLAAVAQAHQAGWEGPGSA